MLSIFSKYNFTFQCTTQDLTNGVINSAFMLLFRDLIRLFACYNDGIINLLGKVIYVFYNQLSTKIFITVHKVNNINHVWFSEKYFDMNKKNAKEALDSYKKFLIRMDRVAEFLKVAEVSFKAKYSKVSKFIYQNKIYIKLFPFYSIFYFM